MFLDLPPEIIGDILDRAGPSGQAAALHTCRLLNTLAADKCSPPAVLKDVIKYGDVNTYIWAVLAGYTAGNPTRSAIKYGNLDVLKLCYACNRDSDVLLFYLRCAMEAGHINVIRWLGFRIKGMPGTVHEGRYGSINWTERLLLDAIESHNSRICVKWVLTEFGRRVLISTKFLRNIIQTNKNLEICSLIVDLRPDAFTKPMSDSHFANLKMLEWMLSRGLMKTYGSNHRHLNNEIHRFINRRHINKNHFIGHIDYVRGKSLPHVLEVLTIGFSIY